MKVPTNIAFAGSNPCRAVVMLDWSGWVADTMSLAPGPVMETANR
jgi:hypothetical protein